MEPGCRRYRNDNKGLERATRLQIRALWFRRRAVKKVDFTVCLDSFGAKSGQSPRMRAGGDQAVAPTGICRD